MLDCLRLHSSRLIIQGFSRCTVHCLLCQEVRYYFSIVILVFVLVVQSISLCRCRSSFGKSVVNVVSFIRCLMFLFTRAKGSPRLCFIYSRCHFVFLSLLFYPSLCVSYACRPSFMKRGLGECPFNRRKPPNCEKCGFHISGTSSQD